MFSEDRSTIHVCTHQHTFLNFEPVEALFLLISIMACKQALRSGCFVKQLFIFYRKGSVLECTCVYFSVDFVLFFSGSNNFAVDDKALKVMGKVFLLTL